jgi:uncharacterized protein (TIGR02246 family)
MEDGIRHATSALADALARGDAGGAAALYTDDGKLLTPGAELLAGRSQIEEYWRAGIAMGLSSVRLDVDRLEVVGGFAVEIGRYTLALADSAVADSGKYVVLHGRQPDGSWRRAVDVFNPDPKEKR